MTQTYRISNVSKYDISVYDLGVRIPRNRTMDLLDVRYKLEIDDIRRSRNSGVLLSKIAKNQLVELDSLTEEIITVSAKAADEARIIDEAESESMQDPMTTRGDIIYRNLSNVTDRLAIGLDGYVLTSNGTDVLWAEGMQDPMTTRGDVIYRNASNVTSRLPIGLDGYVLTSTGTDALWEVNLGNETTRTFDIVYFSDEYDNGSSGAAKTINWNFAQQHMLTLTDNCVLTFVAPTSGPTRFTFKVKQNGTGGYAITYPGTVHTSGGTAPTLTGTANSVDLLAVYWDGTTYYIGMAMSDVKAIS